MPVLFIVSTLLNPGHAAAQGVTWDLSPPPGVDTSNSFLTELVGTLRSEPFDSNKLDDAIRDMVHPDNRLQGVATLCAAMAQPNFDRIFGPSHVAIQLFKQGQTDLANRMLPFLVTVSERTREIEGLQAFAYVCPKFRDKRVVPRLTALLEHANVDVRRESALALSQITLTPPARITVAEMKSWWNRNQGKSSTAIWQEGLRSKDPALALSAAQMLMDEHDKGVIPALCTVLKSDNTKAVMEGRLILEQITGNDWDIKPELPMAERAKLVAKLEKWWSVEKDRFEWRNAKSGDQVAGLPAGAANAPQSSDPLAEMVTQLGRLDGVKMEQAEAQLKSAGNAAVPALIAGLSNENMLIRRKCNGVLKAISGKDMGYDPRASQEAITTAIGKWKAWAREQKIPLGPGEPEELVTEDDAKQRPR